MGGQTYIIAGAHVDFWVGAIAGHGTGEQARVVPKHLEGLPTVVAVAVVDVVEVKPEVERIDQVCHEVGAAAAPDKGEGEVRVETPRNHDLAKVAALTIPVHPCPRVGWVGWEPSRDVDKVVSAGYVS